MVCRHRGHAVSVSTGHRIFTTSLASVYPLYLAKVERKGRTRDELDAAIRWLTGYDQSELSQHLAAGTTFASFFDGAHLNPNAARITGVVCGVRVEAIEDPLMQRIRYLDKLVDELAKGRPLEKVLRGDEVQASTPTKSTAPVPGDRTAAQVNVLTTLPAAMTGRASPAKAAVGDKPVFAYLASLPQPQRSIAERVDALAAETLPSLQRSVKWGMAWYGVGDGWCFACGGFVGHVKLAFGRGTSLTPVPPVTPIGMGKETRGVDLESFDDIDERQLASWMRQATAIPGFGGKKR